MTQQTNPEFNAAFAARLAEALTDFSKVDVASSIGRSVRSLNGWLNGSSTPGADSVAGLCFALNVSADWLLGLKS